jgi:hypothetical protein
LNSEGDKPKAKGHGRLGAKDYPNREKVPVHHPDLKSGDPCPEPPCPGHLYSIAPGSFVHIAGQSMAKVIEYVMDKLRCSACGIVVTAPLPESAGSKKYDETFKSLVVLNRYFMATPFYRQASFQRMLGAPLAQSTQWGIVDEVANAVVPVVNQLKYLSAQGELIRNDDTVAKILSVIQDHKDNPGQKRTGTFTTGIVGSYGNHKIVLFYHGRQHAGENLAQVLNLREADLPPIKHMCDALKANITGHEVILCHCLAHGRRKFVEIEHLYPTECALILDQIGIVYHYDKVAKEEGLSDEARLTHHQEHSLPVMNMLMVYLKSQIDEKRTEPNSALGKAIQYMLNHWQALSRFLTVAGTPLDNNETEQALKMPIRSRKNSMFYATEYSAMIAGWLMSIIYTCHTNNINPLPYLTALQKNHRQVTLNPGKWLPWNYQQALVEMTVKKAA